MCHGMLNSVPAKGEYYRNLVTETKVLLPCDVLENLYFPLLYCVVVDSSVLRILWTSIDALKRQNGIKAYILIRSLLGVPMNGNWTLGRMYLSCNKGFSAKWQIHEKWASSTGFKSDSDLKFNYKHLKDIKVLYILNDCTYACRYSL